MACCLLCAYIVAYCLQDTPVLSGSVSKPQEPAVTPMVSFGQQPLSVAPAEVAAARVQQQSLPTSVPSPNRTMLSAHSSAALARSVGGSAAQPAWTTIASSAPDRADGIAAPVTYVALPPKRTAPAQPAATSATYQPVSAPKAGAPRRPGEIETTWQTWLDQYYQDNPTIANGDLSGLEAWWNQNFGGGAVPGIYDDFYEWAASQLPLSDGVGLLLLGAMLCAWRRNKRIKKQLTDNRSL